MSVRTAVSVKRRLQTGGKMQTEGKMQTADCRLQTGGKMQTEGKIQTADCRPGVNVIVSRVWMANFHPSANTNISIKWSTKIKCLSQTRLDTYKFSLPCTCAVVFCCPVFPFEATMTLAGLNVTL